MQDQYLISASRGALLATAISFISVTIACAADFTKLDAERVKIEGSIGREDGEKLRPLLEGVRTIVVNSAGGDSLGSARLGKLVRERKLDVVVEGNCSSGCAGGIFTAAEHKTVLPGGTVCFHGGFLKDIDEYWERVGGRYAYYHDAYNTLKEFTRMAPERNKRIIQQQIKEQQALHPGKSDAEINDLLMTEQALRMVESSSYRRILYDQEYKALENDIFAGKNIAIINDSQHIYISPRLSQLVGSKEIDPFKLAWCPSPDELRRYGYDKLDMWYPETEDELFKIGLTQGGTILSKRRYDPETGQPNEPGGRHIEAKTVFYLKVEGFGYD